MYGPSCPRSIRLLSASFLNRKLEISRLRRDEHASDPHVSTLSGKLNERGQRQGAAAEHPVRTCTVNSLAAMCV